MHTPPAPPFAATDADEPDRATLPPAVAALLDFDPVPRQINRPDGWTPPRQRAFIALLAQTGSPRAAADAMEKNLSGLKHLYRSEGAEGFRAAWKAAIELGAEAKRHARAATPPPPRDVPGIVTRDPFGGKGQAAYSLDDEAADMSDERKLELLANIGVKFLKKVAAEREARLAGQIVSADFYLRQVTMLEVTIDLMSGGLGCPWDVMAELRRGGHGLLQIAETPFSRALDARRRAFWESNGEPMRDEAFREEFMRDHDDHRTQAQHNAYGTMTDPARGYSEEQWAAMTIDEQKEARHRQFDEDAAAQVDWERGAYEEFRARARALAADDAASAAAKHA